MEGKTPPYEVAFALGFKAADIVRADGRVGLSIPGGHAGEHGLIEFQDL